MAEEELQKISSELEQLTMDQAQMKQCVAPLPLIHAHTLLSRIPYKIVNREKTGAKIQLRQLTIEREELQHGAVYWLLD
jgi:hypothetical protein